MRTSVKVRLTLSALVAISSAALSVAYFVGGQPTPGAANAFSAAAWVAVSWVTFRDRV